MKRVLLTTVAVCALAFASMSAQGKGWVTLFDGKNLNHFNLVGNANWKVADGIVEATTGPGYLVSKETYGDFDLKVEFWVDSGTANSGVYLRCQDGTKIADTTCYEANIFDARPDQSGRTGSIVHVSKPSKNIDAAGKWNTYEIYAKGSQLTVKLNGAVTVSIYEGSFKSGPFTLQFGNAGKDPGGPIKWRKVAIKEL